jgi:ribosomal protein S18 acetylase RimI-like enzyme
MMTAARAFTAALDIRAAELADAWVIGDLMRRCEVFGPAERDCVDEMFRETWAAPRPDNYRWLIGWRDGQPAGFACYGLESLTRDTWDLFWICVAPEARGQGVGQALLARAERQARQEDGRLMVIYTASTPAYAPARRLYERCGFVRVATVPDYYADGDHLHIYWKRLCG